MTLDEYIFTIKTIESNTLEDIEKWIAIVNHIHSIDSRSIPISKLYSYITEIQSELDIETVEGEIHNFTHNGVNYKVDTTVFTANVALFADYNIKTKRYKGIDQLKQVLSLLVYAEGEPDDYSIERSNLNLQRLGDLELTTAIQIVKFFFLLLENYIRLSAISLEVAEMTNLIANLPTD